MSLEPDLIALRHSERPGFRYIGFREIGIPVFYIKLRALVIQERKLATVDEFILKCVQNNISNLYECASFLGLRNNLVMKRIVDLRIKELVEINGIDDQAKIILTPAGDIAVKELCLDTVSECTLEDVPIHGWTREPFLFPRDQALSSHQADGLNLLKLRAVPSRIPEATEIDMRSLRNNYLPKLSRRTDKKLKEILAIQSVLKGIATLYMPAIMLQWQPLAGGKTQVGFVIDQRIDTETENIFGKINGLEVFAGIFNGEIPTCNQIIEEQLPPHIINHVKRDLICIQDSDAINQANIKLQVHQHELETKNNISTDRPDTRMVLKSKNDELEAELLKLKHLAGQNPRMVETTEIRQLFKSAFITAKKRILIACPFLSDSVVNQEFEKSCIACLKRDVRLLFSVGRDEDMLGQPDYKVKKRERSLERLEYLKKLYPNLVVLVYKNHHSKVLVCDSIFAIVGSYNFLSFTGDYKQIRIELSILLQNTDCVNATASHLSELLFC